MKQLQKFEQETERLQWKIDVLKKGVRLSQAQRRANERTLLEVREERLALKEQQQKLEAREKWLKDSATSLEHEVHLLRSEQAQLSARARGSPQPKGYMELLSSYLW